MWNYITMRYGNQKYSHNSSNASNPLITMHSGGGAALEASHHALRRLYEY